MSTATEGIYRRVSMRMYGDEKFMRLTPLQASGQALWLYLLTGPHTCPIPGVFVIGKAAMAEALGWPNEAFEKAFGEVFAEGLVEFDAKTRLWFIPNAIKHNMPANPNVVKSWRGPWSLLPECGMRDRIGDHLFTSVNTLSEAFGKAFAEACGKAFAKASAKHSPKQETGNSEQERVARTNPTRSPAPAHAVLSDRKSTRGTRLPVDWSLSEEYRAFCVLERPDLNPRAVAERFRDHWLAAPGKAGVKADWLATWRNWVRKEHEGRPGPARSAVLNADHQFVSGATQ